MSDPNSAALTPAFLTTTIVAFLSGFMLGVYSIRGYLISPDLAAERAANFNDPVESEESDIDEDDTPLDHAPNWANAAEADRRQGLRLTEAGKRNTARAEAAADAAAELLGSTEECKLVLVVRTDLGMTKGKIAAQASHATLACYKTMSSFPPSSPQFQLLRRWERHGQAKIAVQIKSQDEMLALQKKARELGLAAEVIADAGRTQIEAGSLTVLGVGPGPKSAIDKITGGLKLL